MFKYFDDAPIMVFVKCNEYEVTFTRHISSKDKDLPIAMLSPQIRGEWYNSVKWLYLLFKTFNCIRYDRFILNVPFNDTNNVVRYRKTVLIDDPFMCDDFFDGFEKPSMNEENVKYDQKIVHYVKNIEKEPGRKVNVKGSFESSLTDNVQNVGKGNYHKYKKVMAVYYTLEDLKYISLATDTIEFIERLAIMSKADRHLPIRLSLVYEIGVADEEDNGRYFLCMEFEGLNCDHEDIENCISHLDVLFCNI